MVLNDRVRAAIIGTVQSLFPLLVILGLVDLTDVQIGAIMLFITNAITLAALVLNKGQEGLTPAPQETTVTTPADSAVSVTVDSTGNSGSAAPTTTGSNVLPSTPDKDD